MDRAKCEGGSGACTRNRQRQRRQTAKGGLWMIMSERESKLSNKYKRARRLTFPYSLAVLILEVSSMIRDAVHHWISRLAASCLAWHAAVHCHMGFGHRIRFKKVQVSARKCSSGPNTYLYVAQLIARRRRSIPVAVVRSFRRARILTPSETKPATKRQMYINRRLILYGQRMPRYV